MSIEEGPMVPEFFESQQDLNFKSLQDETRKVRLFSIIEGPQPDGQSLG